MPYDKTQQARIDAGLCKECGQPRGNDGTSIRCRPCASDAAKRATARSARVRKERLANQTCFYCGKLRDGKTIFCATCRVKMAARGRTYAEQYRRERNEQGVCRRCGKERYYASNYCRMHFMEHIARKYHVPQPLWDALLQKLEASSFQCFYTGKQLIPGENACVDHLNARSQYPDKVSDLDNFVWCDKWVNRMKGHLSYSDFIALCHTIVERASMPVERV